MECLSQIDCFGLCRKAHADEQEIENTENNNKNADNNNNINNKVNTKHNRQKSKNNNIYLNVDAEKTENTANNIYDININNDELPKPINDIEKQDDKKDAKNKDKKTENKDLKTKSNKINENQNIYNNKLKQQPSQKKHTVNKNILSKPSQTFEEIKKTDKHLHNFLTRIVIKICELEESFCNDNHVDCSKFWNDLVGYNKKTSETNDTLFTEVLNRNYNNYNICNNNQTLRLLGNNFIDIKGNQKTSEIVNKMVQQKSCKQLESILRVNNEDKNKLKNLKPHHESSLGDKTLQDPMTPTINHSPINKSTEIMLMLMNVQDVAFDIYNGKKSNKQEKQHAKNILLFFRQVLTILYEKKIISLLDKRPKSKQVTVPVEMEENQQYWHELSSNRQIKQKKSLIDFNLNEDTENIQKIDLTKLFWKNGKQFDGKDFHHIQAEMKDCRQCINEQTDFALNNSIMLDEIKK